MIVVQCRSEFLMCRVDLERWSAGSRNVMAWTVNNSAEKAEFKSMNIPFFTDSVTQECPEAWIPPTRRVTAGNLLRLVLIHGPGKLMKLIDDALTVSHEILLDSF